MKYLFAIFFITLCNAVNAAATRLHLFKDTAHAPADTDTVARQQSISIGVNYGSDIQFFGRTGPVKYPYASGDAIYNFKSGFFVYGSAVQVFGYTPVVDEVDLGAGYLFKYSKALTGTFSYTRFIFTKDAPPVIMSASSNDINFKNAFDWKFAKSSATFDYLFGDANDYFITLSTAKHIETSWSIFDDKDYLSIDPGVSMIIGTQNFVGRYSTLHPQHLYYDNSVRGLDIPPYFHDYDNGKFRMLNYSLKLPISYNRPHYTFEASWKYSIPVNVEGALKNRHEVFFNLTFFYLFFK
ncbi:hypothetical protein [Mucilaginibacter gotjawali]|uniref:Outer membrane protein beta-barrel domain-containing protein n=1 Tax=Mucilaginibacter gotjawali TaxID=1550579 RepID=A0A839SFU4_9SPHI|nr:hypothetical protein [Mucilaginibacter gotjawali]MBB3057141.1 hypothetical protein [Mucilaginibacter gotjawali]